MVIRKFERGFSPPKPTKISVEQAKSKKPFSLAELDLFNFYKQQAEKAYLALESGNRVPKIKRDAEMAFDNYVANLSRKKDEIVRMITEEAENRLNLADEISHAKDQAESLRQRKRHIEELKGLNP
jgi:hypothetical protein